MDVITFPENLLTTGGLSILLNCVISLPDAINAIGVVVILYLKRIFKCLPL